MLADGRVSVSVEGHCPTCGDIHITSGDWRRENNPDRYVMVNPKDHVDDQRPDYLFGNPLTHGDKRSEAYGKNRYAQGEGLHGTATTRFGLFKDRAFYRRVDQPRLDVLLTYCLMHGMSMEARRRKAHDALPSPVPLPQAGSAPPLALAA